MGFRASGGGGWFEYGSLRVLRGAGPVSLEGREEGYSGYFWGVGISEDGVFFL